VFGTVRVGIFAGCGLEAESFEGNIDAFKNIKAYQTAFTEQQRSHRSHWSLHSDSSLHFSSS